MQGMNYLAIVVAAVAAFVASVVWYALFGNAMTELREADPPPQPTRERRFGRCCSWLPRASSSPSWSAYFLSRLGTGRAGKALWVSAPGVGFPSRDPAGLRRPRGHPLDAGRHPRR